MPIGRRKGLGGGRLTGTVGLLGGRLGGGLFGGGSGGGDGIVEVGRTCWRRRSGERRKWGGR